MFKACTPSALARRSGDPNRTILGPFLGFGSPLKGRLPLKVDRHGGPCRIRSTFKGGCAGGGRGPPPHVWPKNGPIWVPRPPDRCTGGETGPRNRSPLLPRPCGTKKRPISAKIQNLTPDQFFWGSGARMGTAGACPLSDSVPAWSARSWRRLHPPPADCSRLPLGPRTRQASPCPWSRSPGSRWAASSPCSAPCPGCASQHWLRHSRPGNNGTGCC